MATISSLLSPSSDSWSQMDGLARDIAASARGDVFAIGTAARTGGSTVFEWLAGKWVDAGIGALRVAVAPDGTPWVVDDRMDIHCRENGLWIRVQGESKDIGVGANGLPWVIGPDARPGGFGVHRFVSKASGWERIDGCNGVRVSVDPLGRAWVVNNLGDVYAFDGKGFVHKAIGAVDVAVGADGSVAIASAQGGVRFAASGQADWTTLSRHLVSLAVLPDGQIIGCDEAAQIWTYGGLKAGQVPAQQGEALSSASDALAGLSPKLPF